MSHAFYSAAVLLFAKSLISQTVERLSSKAHGCWVLGHKHRRRSDWNSGGGRMAGLTIKVLL